MYGSEFDRYFKEVKEVLRGVLNILQEAERKAERHGEDLRNFINADFITQLFERDAERIEEEYMEGVISKKEAIDLLRGLEETVDNLEEYNLEFWNMIHELEKELKIVQRSLPRPPERGIPVGYVKERIKDKIGKVGSGIKSTKKEFGILKLDHRPEDYKQEISDFLEEYESGVIVATPEVGNDVRNALDGKVRFEERNVGGRLLFIVGG